MSKAVGIEIRDDSSLNIAYISKTPFGIKVKGYRTLNGSKEELKNGLKGFFHEIGHEKIPLTIGLPEGSVISKVLKIPAQRREDLRGIMAFEIEKHIPFSIENAYYDFQPLNKDNSIWNVIMVAAKREFVDRCMDYLKDVNAEPICIDTESFSKFNAISCRNRLPKDNKIAIISSCPDGISIDAFEGNMLIVSKTVPVDKEKWPDWIKIIEGEIKAYIEKMEVLHSRKGLDKLWIAADRDVGEDDRIILEKSTGIPVTIEPPDKYDLPLGASISTFGLALRGVGKGELKLNLFPTITDERKASGLLPTTILAIMVILMGIAIGFSTSAKDRLTLSKLDLAIEEIGPETKEVKVLKERLKDIQEKLMVLENIRSAPPPLDLLKELTGGLPDHTWLKEMDYNRGELFLIGLSDQASNLLPILEGFSFLEDVRFTGPITTEPGGKERFKIKAKVNKGTVPIYRRSEAER